MNFLAKTKEQSQFMSKKYRKFDSVFWVVILFLTIKILWGYWDRDITSGDTSSYFLDAARWHLDKTVNIVWSPLYTAYLGSWLNVSENAVIAVFLHRVGLIVITTMLVGWFALSSLPRSFALLLTCWWIALPIHYDTLYEVHLFGAIPLMLMATAATVCNEKWRLPILISISIIATILIRNEFILATGCFIVLALIRLIKMRGKLTSIDFRFGIIRSVALVVLVSAIVTFFYTASYIQGNSIKEASEPKHRLNMCQVYAFGYQQRNPSWTGSPWTDCSNLMKEKFGELMPSLNQMIRSNPTEVIQHFWWNLSLTRAGLEVLLFNATSGDDNPDYAPVKTIPIVPTLLLGLSLLIVIIGSVIVYRDKSSKYILIRENIHKLTPVLLAVIVMSLAVILTQRPRPSYLLGAGMLYMWLVMLSLDAISSRYKSYQGNYSFLIISVALLAAVPSYKYLNLPSKQTQIKLLYSQLLPNQEILCGNDEKIALGDFQFEIISYLCSTSPGYLNGVGHNERGFKKPVRIFALDTIGPQAFVNPKFFVSVLEHEGVISAVIDQFLLLKNPSLESCASLRDAFLEKGWQQLTYLVKDDGLCIASYTKR